MLSIFDSVNELLGDGDTISTLSRGMGVEGATAQKAASSAAPVLLSGLADRAQQPGGSAAVMGMLDNVDSSAIDGAGLLDGIFDSKLGGVMENLAGSTGLGVGTVGKLLPMLAPMVMGVISKRRHADGLDGTGLTNVLIGEQAKMERDGFLSGGTLGKLGGAAAAGGAVLGGVATASGKLGSVGDAASGAAGKLGDVGDVATDGLGKVGGAVTGGAGKLGGAVAGGAGALGGAAGGAMPNVGGSGGRFGKLGWILGAVAAVALAAWALSQCGGGDVVDTATGTIDNAVETVEETVDEVTDEAVEVVEDAAETVEETVEDAVDYQPGVDTALAASGIAGISGVIDDAGVVTLSGEVDSPEAKLDAEAAVADVEGVTAVNNTITVVAAESAPAAGSTINDILDLDPITFAVNSSEITAEGQAVLGSAVEFMTANPTVNVEIAGHTDSDGDDGLNEALSQSRADSVKAFLVDNGVEAERMTTKGYGESAPKVDNDTPENKAINRRIEFTIQ